jgi:hypothetical protein
MLNCSNRNCNINMQPDYFIVHSKYEIYEKILNGLMKTELFCITCCVNQTNNICSNSNIPIKNYFVGYIHSLEKT